LAIRRDGSANPKKSRTSLATDYSYRLGLPSKHAANAGGEVVNLD
jgi:hypothetical protein